MTNNPTCNHEWIVFSTCITTIELMVECDKCGAFGTVANPSKREWADAFKAPSRPYRWADDKRVMIRKTAENDRAKIKAMHVLAARYGIVHEQLAAWLKSCGLWSRTLEKLYPKLCPALPAEQEYMKLTVRSQPADGEKKK